MVKFTALLAISTPHDERNFFSKLLQLKFENGEPLMYVVRAGSGCAACAAKNKVCPQEKKTLDSWRTVEGLKKVTLIMKTDKDQADRELHGIVGQSGRQYLLQPYLTQFQNLPDLRWKRDLDVVYMGIDPAGGGDSDYSLSSIGFEDDYVGIVGIDFINTAKYNEPLEMISNHIMSMRSDLRYKEAILVVAIEANMSWQTAEGVAAFLQQPQFGEVLIISRDKKRHTRPGVITDENMKERYAEDLRRVMSNGALRYAENPITDSELRMRGELEQQIEQFHRVVKDPDEDAVGGKTRVAYKGKGNGMQDDVIMSLMIALSFAKIQRCDPEFVKLCQDRHLRF